MPRKAPDGKGVTEHRITLGDFERREFKQAAEDYKTALWVRNAPKMMVGGAAVGLVGILGFAGYQAWLWWKDFDFFPITAGEEALLARVFNPTAAFKSGRKEDIILGTPKDAAQYQVMLIQNTDMIANKLFKAETVVSMASQGAMPFSIILAKAKEYVNVGHGLDLALLADWEIYHTDRLLNA